MFTCDRAGKNRGISAHKFCMIFHFKLILFLSVDHTDPNKTFKGCVKNS